MDSLQRYFDQNKDRQINKWTHYFDVYERYFSAYRNKPVVILEIGIFQGGSLQMWKSYFGKEAKIYGVDINPTCKDLEEENIQVFIGSQSDRSFLKKLKESIPPIDILIDDGGHTMQQQIVTFEELYDHIKPIGVYLCEDLHTSYWVEYGGGYKRRGTFIEYAKKLVDSLNAFHSEQRIFKPNKFASSTDSLHFHDSILVIEKRPRTKPHEISSGKQSFNKNIQNAIQRSAVWRFKFKTLYIINSVLRFFRISSFKWK